MLKSKLIKTLKLLTEKELENFGYYLNCPIYNKDKKLVELLNILAIHHPLYDAEDKLNKNLIFKKIYPDKKRVDSSLRVLMSRLTKLLEEFCTTVILQKDEKLQQRLKLNFLTNRKSELEELQKNIEQHESHAWSGTDALYHQLYLMELYLSKAPIAKNPATKYQSVQSIVNSIDAYCTYLKIRYIVFSLSNGVAATNELVDKNLLQEVTHLTKCLPINEFPFIHLYHQAYLLLTAKEENKDYFDKLFFLFQKYQQIITQQEGLQISMLLIKFCKNKLLAIELLNNSSLLSYEEKLFKLYCIALEKDYLNFKHLPMYFIDIVDLGLSMHKYRWVRNFVKQYATSLTADIRDNLVNLSLTKLHFCQQKYASAQNYLFCNKSYPNDELKLIARILSIKINYELENKTALKQETDALRVYVFRTQKLSISKQKKLNNFIRVVNRLRYVKSLSSLAKAKETIMTPEGITEKTWLLEKIMEVETQLTRKTPKQKKRNSQQANECAAN